VQSISVIPEVIKRSVYIKECSRLMDIEENVLYTEVNRQRRKRFEQLVQRESREPKEKETPRLPSYVSGVVCEEQEKEIISFLLNYGSKTLYNSQSEENKDDEINITVGQYIIDEILNDELEFQNLAYKMIFDEYAQLLSQNQAVDNRHFINHYNPQISQLAVDLMSSRHKLSRIWEKHKAEVTDDPDFLLHAVPKAIQVYKSKVLKIAIKNLTDELTHLSAQQKDETDEILKRLLELNKLMNSMSKGLDRVVL